MGDEKTNNLVKRWQQAKESVESCKRELNSCECELSNATTALEKWLLPADAAASEKFHIWHNGKLIEVAETSGGPFHGDYTIKIRE